MTSYAFGALIDVESSENTSERLPVAPEKALPRTYSVQEPVELANINTKQNGSSVSRNASTPSGTRTPPTPSELEINRPATPQNEDNSVEAMQSFSSPPMNRFRMLSVCLLNFGNGLNDSAPGALIPYIEKHYQIGYATVSLIFVTNAVGFILAALFVEALRSRLGRGRTLMISQALVICGYIPIVCTAPFPAIVFSFFLLGLGIAINLAMGNVFCANLHNATAALGVMHGSYGLGGTIGPLIATAMVTTGGLIFSRYYFLILAVAFFNLFFSGWSFWHYEAETGQNLLTAIEQTASRTQNSAETTVQQKNRVKVQIADMAKAFKSKTVILGALFIFPYQGAEVSISGCKWAFLLLRLYKAHPNNDSIVKLPWSDTNILVVRGHFLLIATRHGNPAAVGYVTSGFWGGITLGRFILSHPAHKIGEKIFVYGVILGAAVFELLVWLVPNIVGDAVAIAFVGLLLGPVYPCATVIFSRAIGRKEQVSSLSVISAFGSSGGAVAPFTTGILAQAAGTFVLHPIAIGLFAVMLVCWFCLPNTRKRTD